MLEYNGEFTVYLLRISYRKRGKINGKLRKFARVYDELMDNVPYEEWADFILAILKKNKITDGLVLELWLWNRKVDVTSWKCWIRHDWCR